MSANATADEDDFDWEAAVREIDSACEFAAASTSAGPSTSYAPARSPPRGSSSFAVPGRLARAPADGRQSTLDGFVKCRGGKVGGLGKACATEGKVRAGERRGGRGRNGFGISRGDHGEGGPEVDIDLEAAKTWIYPTNIPSRDYQLSIAEICLFSNTLVALPTGLGKTLIAAVVMYNYFRWFPGGKIVFAAPSRPLVIQQIEACLNIVGIPQECSTDMTGVINPTRRRKLWKNKRVFFVTPQVLEKDIQSGSCPAKKLVCLVVDEAHRAIGNHAYCVAVRELMALPVQLRILALTATPGSKHQSIQNVIDNLQISTLEYRNEGHQDVSPYVHDRTLELVKVEVGSSALEIRGLLLEVARPFVHKLSAEGGLHSRDLATLSPYLLLNSLTEYKEKHPHADAKGKEIEGLYYTLVSLYHMYNLLSSHGIKPAYDMLEDNLSRCKNLLRVKNNEFFSKARNLMLKALGQGAPSPKLAKMIQILVKHFEQNDPMSSRVIIFSNFRGSVKEIMDSLTNIGDTVRATEFIGQSSAKASKGQNQKIQQAVLEKFRKGEYNVLVATSIGEEGLDIVEVDLVICFDANVSSVRMIQRMGRTGRKHDGRVVVLACEGHELKGYLRKQASGKTIRKHMYNGGIQSFSFHSSPRMVPHICKPEVRFVEISIEKFIHPRKKVNAFQKQNSPVPNKLSDEENNLISRYFNHSKANTWKASLIAFPHFQSFATRVHQVYHSYRTKEMFIGTVQRLQQPSCRVDQTLDVEVNYCLVQPVNLASLACDNNSTVEACPILESNGFTDCQASNFDAYSNSCHNFVFNTGFVTVNIHGFVEIASVPCLPFTREMVSAKSRIRDQGFHVREMNSLGKSVFKVLSNPKNIIAEKMTLVGGRGALEDESAEPVNNIELSPRLTHLIEKGVVPESPNVCYRQQEYDCYLSTIPSLEHGENVVEQCPSASLVAEACMMTGLSNHPVCADASPKPVLASNSLKFNSPTYGQLACEIKLQSDNCKTMSPCDEDADDTSALKCIHTSLSEDWQPHSEDVHKLNEYQTKYKRLRKCADVGQKVPCVNLEERMNIAAEKQHNKGPKRNIRRLNSFIEEEAEVSADATISEDEEEKNDDNYEDSFIDDQINLTEEGTQAQNSGDMMAFYRRSLLTQSPGDGPFHYTCTSSGEPNSVKSSEIGSCSSRKKRMSAETPEVPSGRSDDEYSVSKQLVSERSSLLAMNAGITQITMDQNTECRKRKLIFQYGPIVPQQEHPSKKEAMTDLLQHSQRGNGKAPDIFCDDDFYMSLDLDALEAQATRILRSKSELSATTMPDPTQTSSLAKKANPTGTSVGSPSFDLGI